MSWMRGLVFVDDSMIGAESAVGSMICMKQFQGVENELKPRRIYSNSYFAPLF